MASAPLPPALATRLAALADRVRRLRVARGACWLVVAALLSGAAVVLLDALLGLSVTARCLLQLGWLAGTALLAWRLVARPWRAAIPLEGIARQIEEQFPGLGERLLSVVELRDAAEPANGSPQLIASLARETELRTRSMDFAEAAPVRPVAWLAGAAGGAFLLAALFAAVVPGSGERLRRVAVPWYRPPQVVPFRVVVTSGEPVVRRGDPVTLSAYLERADPHAPLPDAAVLVFRDGPGSAERKLPMTGNGSAAFHVTRPGVAADFEYRVEAGPAVSDWHAVAVADPVELTEQSAADVSPPAYAAGLVPARTVSGLTELEGLQYATAVLRLRFSRPPATAFLDWRPAGGGQTVLTQVQLAPDGLSGTATFPLRENGTLRVVLLNDTGPRKLRTETPIPVRVTPDGPPRFEQVSGVATQARTVRPGEHVPVALVAVDDVAVAAAELEYVVGPDDAKAVRLPLSLGGLGTPRAEGRFVFDLAGKAREGETIRFRVRVADNRKLDDPRLDAQEAVYPPSGWAELRLSASAPPLEYQEILGQRDQIGDALSAALKEVNTAAAETENLRGDLGDASFTLDQSVRLSNIRERRVRVAAAGLHDAARSAALTPELRSLAAAIRDVADHPLRGADDSLGKAGTNNPADRKAAFAAAEKALATAANRIEELLRANDRLAQDRLDYRKLTALATDQDRLADRAATAPPKELLPVQQELLERLRKLLAESDSLRRGTDAAAGRDVRELGASLKELAGLLRDLDAAARGLSAETRRELVEGLSRLQSALAAKAAGLLARTETAARLARVAVPKPDEFRRPAELIAAGKTAEALTEMERLAQSLDAVAVEFEKWAAERADPKLAARQLARWQDDLRTRFAAATKATAFRTLPDSVRAGFKLEQQAIHRSAERLKLTPDEAITAARGTALEQLGKAVESLGGDGLLAEPSMKSAADALHRLADQTPDAGTRLGRARTDLQRLLGDQESISNQADLALRGADPSKPDVNVKKLAALHDRQQKLLQGFVALDLPGLDVRRERALVAVATAVADLKDGLPYDVPASQMWAKRELERLRHAIDGTSPSDDRADELARKQAAIANGVAALGENPTAKQLEPLAAAQQELFRSVESFLPPDAPVLAHAAHEAVRAAEVGFRDGAKWAELPKRTRAATDALARLADRLNEREADLDRVRRLTAVRKQAVADARKPNGKPAVDLQEALRQLTREVAELAHTRVGAAGQVVKKEVLDLYAKARMSAPGAAVQNDLLTALDRLAAKMADVPELTSAPPHPEPPGPDAADEFIPSKPLAGGLRDLAREQRATRDRAAGLGAEFARRTRPSEANPLAALERQQSAVAAGAAELARALGAEKDATAAEGATRTAEAAKLAADRVRLGQVRPAKEAGELSLQRLRQLVASAGMRPWGKAAADLVAKQEAVLNGLAGLLDDPSAAAAQQLARQAELAKRAAELAHLLDQAARNVAADDPAAAALREAAKMAQAAENKLGDAGKKAAGGMPADAEKLRAEAEKMVADAAAKAGSATGMPTTAPEADPLAQAAGAAIRLAEAAMRKAAAELGAGKDTSAAERAMRQAADALKGAAKSLAGPAGSPTAGAQSNGNPGTAAAPITPGDLTPVLTGDLGAVWGDLPGEVRARVVQDLQARYGEDFAKAIKLYFEQLAERK
jgi:hypothetical protein